MSTTIDRRPAHRARRAVGNLVGVVVAVVGILTALGAVALLVLFGTSSTLSSGTHRFATPTAVLVADAGSVTETAAAARVIGTPTVRVSVTAGHGPVFVGIGHAADVDHYLAGVATTEVAGYGDWSQRLTATPRPGQAIAGAPARQGFWVASATGPSAADLTWRPQDGRYRIVVMNVDGSPGVTADAHASVQLPNAFDISLAALLVGLLMSGAGVAALVAVNRSGAGGGVTGAVMVAAHPAPSP